MSPIPVCHPDLPPLPFTWHTKHLLHYSTDTKPNSETKIREALRKTMKSVGDTRGGAKKTEAKRKRVEIVVEENVEKEDGGHDDGGNDDGGNDDGGNDDGGNDDGGNDDGGNDDEENDELDEDGQPKKKTKLSAVARGKQPTHGPKKPPGGGRGGRGGRRGGGGGGHIPGAGIMNVD